MTTTILAQPANHDFDFLVGQWTVRHRLLKERLVGCTEWEEFGGFSMLHTLMGGFANVDDNVIELPTGTYRAISLRSFDAASGRWSIWWLDGRHPLHIDVPVRGSFNDGIGVFFADDEFKGAPIRVRFTWSDITANTCRWRQAFSPDGGVTWETNWVMDFTRSQ